MICVNLHLGQKRGKSFTQICLLPQAMHINIRGFIYRIALTSKKFTKPSLFLRLLIRSGFIGKKLLLNCPRVESLGCCRCLLGGGQRVSEPGNGLGLLLDLPVFDFKLPLQRVDGGL